jgi:hypothetical protein
MIIKVEVDLKDFYDEDNDGMAISELIKSEIAYKVKHEVLKGVSDDTKTAISSAVKEMVNSDKKLLISEMVKNTFQNKKLKRGHGHSGNEEVTFEEYIQLEMERQHFNDSDFQRYSDRAIKKSSESLALEIKNRYDHQFASQLVVKMNEAGMLKSDVAKMLLTDSTEEAK